MLLATWNVNSINARLDLLKAFLKEVKPDVIALQETKVEDDKFPNIFETMGYEATFKGQKGYNGVAILSKFGFDSIEKDFKWIEGEEKRIIMVEIKGIKIMDAYFPHGKFIGSSSYQFKLEFIRSLASYLKKFMELPFIIVGDFNVAMEEKDVYEPSILQYSIGFSEEERKALKELYEIGFIDVFRMHNKKDGQYTWWDYRANSFKRNAGMRIDYIWATEKMANKCKRCYIAKEYRAKPKPSDHAPVVAEFEI